MSNDLKYIPNIKYLLSGLLVCFTLLVIDVVSDSIGWFHISHIVIEVLTLVILIILIGYLVVLFFKYKNKTSALTSEVSHWKEQHQVVLQGMSKTISLQFQNWSLTNSQKQIGLFILKGLSFKEIADIRKTSERTVRQQATEMYKKADLKGRHEFSAFFLEDLLLP